jgi:1-acyl-sn-glycerol-3-phosphate acyltransferase
MARPRMQEQLPKQAQEGMARGDNSWKDVGVSTNPFRSLARTLKLALLFVEATGDLIVTRPSTRQERADWLHRFCARAIRRMKIAVHVHGEFPSAGALITNHLSYLDIPVLAALHPCVFVSKREVSDLPIVGWMTTLSGTVYVDRGRGGSALRAGAAMHAAAKDSLPVVFFPEGTTGSGDTLLKFHSGLLGQAMLEHMPITAGYLRYRLGADNAPGLTAAKDIAWGDKPMLQHMLQFLALRGVEAEIHFAPRPIAFSPAALAKRKIAAAEARAAVAELASHVIAGRVPETVS